MNVATTGSYTLSVRVANTTTGAGMVTQNMHVEMDGTTIGSTISVGETGGPQSYVTATKTVNLTAGQRVMRVVFDSGSLNLNWVSFAAVGSGQTPYGGTAPAVTSAGPTTIQAETYDVGGQGVAYNDTTTGNNGPDTDQFRNDDVDIQPSGGTDPGSYNIGWVAAGEWLEYTIDVQSAVNYTLEARVATNSTGKTIHFEVNGTNVSGTMSMPNTGGYQNYQTVTTSGFSLGVGQYVVRAVFDTGSVNLNWIRLVPAGPPPAPTGLGATPGNGLVNLTWSAVSGATSYTVKRGTAAGGPYGTTFANITTNSYANTGLTNGTTYYYVVSATNGSGEGANSGEASATPNAPPASPWTRQDVGAVAAAGTLNESSGTLTMEGSGADIYGTADEFSFAYQNVTGDATITVRLASLENTNVWAKAGVMMRDGTGNNVRYVMALLSPTATNKYRLQARTVAAGSTSSTASTGNSAIPAYLRITRSGNNFTGYFSTNGTTWTQLGTTQNIAMPSTIKVGLAVTSHADGTLATGVFDNVAITQPSAPAIANLVVNDTTLGGDGIANNTQWSVQSNFQTGAVCFGDRTYTVDSIGNAVLTGKAWIKTAADSKSYAEDPLASFTVTGSYVYLLIDDRHNVSGRPAWLTDAAFVDQGYDVVIRQSPTATFPYSVWRKSVTSGSAVNLPMMNTSAAPAYIVVVE